jgi:hypothetical protein
LPRIAALSCRRPRGVPKPTQLASLHVFGLPRTEVVFQVPCGQRLATPWAVGGRWLRP